MSDELSYWEPRVMRHREHDGTEEYAIHEVYFNTNQEAVMWTEDSLSAREPSLERLRDALERLLKSGHDEVTTGDLGYTYDREYIQEWLDSLSQPVLDYVESGED
jgi:hypothetical protein